MHGDEVTGMILMLRLIDEFCTSTDTRIVNILNNVDLFIFPNTNPDGTYYGGNNTVYGARRRNGHNIDLNRHFPDFDDGPHPDGQSYYQDEAQWMMDLAQQYLFTMGANYHGGAEVVNYPWDTYQPLHPDDAWWQLVSHEYADLAQAVNSTYMDDYNDGITNGYAWYTITGSRQDYMNYYAQCREVTIECSTLKTPNASQLPNFWNYNHNSMLTYIEECLNGVHGVVYDAVTNEPLQGVTVTVQNHDAFGSSVSTHVVGDFHRPIKGGTYTFVFSKEGYISQSVEVTLADGQRIDLEPVYLQPIFSQTINFSSGWNWWSTCIDIDLTQLEAALGSNASGITSQNDGFVSYINGLGWQGSLNSITSSKMYKIETDSEFSLTLTGTQVNPSEYLITLNPGDNWIGYPLSQSMSLSEAFAGANPMNGDKVSAYGAYAQYYNGAWYGELNLLQPGQGYVYKSNATITKTFYFPVR